MTSEQNQTDTAKLIHWNIIARGSDLPPYPRCSTPLTNTEGWLYSDDENDLTCVVCAKEYEKTRNYVKWSKGLGTYALNGRDLEDLIFKARQAPDYSHETVQALLEEFLKGKERIDESDI